MSHGLAKLYEKINHVALGNMVDKWHRCLERGNEVCAVFLGIKKAFNKVPHHPLLDKLSALDINPFILCWLESNLMHRSQTVVVGEESSESVYVHLGVPQESVLEPLVSTVYQWSHGSGHKGMCSLPLC